ncbi:Alkylated DNA repair protein alkB-like protein [Smittium culicis]|uniref:Alkylated DNA repair protein alkB-like protein n=1 Tax=Smittium culicis TaxID=133412 RepID=A0A1R1XG25_9FUNG|nr:Alkylated DNA repair protein alkB-like protein [Smittium culicis]
MNEYRDLSETFIENEKAPIEADENRELNKRERKANEKMLQKKKAAYETFAKLEGIDKAEKVFSKLIRKTLIIVNLGYGAVGGATSEEIENVFKKYVGFEKVVMAHGKPYTFVEFRGGEDSVIARQALHEKPCASLNNKILFIEYVNHLDFAYFSDRSSPSITEKLNSAPGLFYFDNLLSETEQAQLLQLISRENFENSPVDTMHTNKLNTEFSNFKQAEVTDGLTEDSWLNIQNRKIQHYGRSFDYRKKHIGDSTLVSHQKIPVIVQNLIQRARSLHPGLTCDFDQLTVQKYDPGTGISFHSDSHTAFGPSILIISLKSPILMEFRHPSTKSLVSQDLKPGSLTLMTGDSRPISNKNS